MPNWNSRGNGEASRQPHGQMLHDPQRRVGLHRAHQPQHRAGRHLGIRVQHQHQLEPLGVAVEEIHDVAGLEAVVRRAPAVADPRRIAIFRTECHHRLLFGRGGGRIRGVGQNEQAERSACTGPVQIVQQAPQRRQHAAHVLIADCHDNCGAGDFATGTRGRNLRLRRREHQQEEADQPIGDAQAGPRRSADEGEQHYQLGQRPAAGCQHSQ